MEVVTITNLLIVIIMIVMIMQIIILVNQQKNGKLVREFLTQKTKPFQPDRDRFRDRKENNFRQNRQNQQDSRSKQPHVQSAPATSAPAADNVEKSLRDINLRLKNAERDQEAARRKINENIGKDQPRRRPHNDNHRGGRDDNREPRRGGDRDRHNRNNWRNRDDQEKSIQESDRPSVQSENEYPVDASLNASPVADMTPTVSAPSLPDLNPTDFDNDSMQHGRKFMVKRRLLKEESPGEYQSGEQETASAPSDSSAPSDTGVNPDPASETAGQVEQTNDSEISFGRR